MTRRAISRAVLTLAAGVVALTGCKTLEDGPEPAVRTVEVTILQPVPCPALAALGAEPAYPDTDEAIRAAANMAERAFLVMTGRKMRIQRLVEFHAAAAACDF